MADERPPSDEHPSAAGDAPADGVFGNLPRSRPGTRSPRRRRAEPSAAEAAEPAPAAQARDTTEPRPQAAEPRGEADELGGDEEHQGGIEDLAWAGVAAAAEAATLGVRLANRALGAVRDTIDRR